MKFQCDGEEDPHAACSERRMYLADAEEAAWSTERKNWCCDHENKHCPEKEVEEEIKYHCDTTGSGLTA